uniref:Uncharacterized protein n=1 Tax=Leersia perrieri TaxID=77586 RepID=A0A0D9W1B2_9ORYZ
MSHGGGGQPSCSSVSIGKAIRRAIRKRINGKPPARRKRPAEAAAAVSDGGGGEVRVSKELARSSSSLRSPEPAVRVVLPSGVVEAYSGVVLACTVIRNHPPGLCLAYPDVFRNPHAARVRPLEPLFPGQKFYLIPDHTMIRLQREIPESSVGAVDDGDTEKEEEEEEDDVTSSTEMTTTTEEEDEEDCSGGDDGECGEGRSWCCARKYFEEKERWEECQFKQMVARGLAVENAAAATKKKKKGKGRRKKRSTGGEGVAATGCRTVRFAPAAAAVATARRMWEPSLPSVEEESSETLPCSE